MVAVELRVERVQDHLADGRTEMVDGARWRWTDEQLAEAEPKIWAELERLLSGSASRPASSSASPATGTRTCSSVSRSRSVTVSSSIVWWSTVIPQGVPISSWRR